MMDTALIGSQITCVSLVIAGCVGQTQEARVSRVAPAPAAVPSATGAPLERWCLAGEKLGAVGYDPAADIITICFADSYRCAALPKHGEPYPASGTVPLRAAPRIERAPPADTVDPGAPGEYVVDETTRVAVSKSDRVCARVTKIAGGAGLNHDVSSKPADQRCVDACPRK